MEIEKVTPYLLVRYGFDSEHELNHWAENLEGPNWRLSDESDNALYTDGDSGIAEIGYSEMFDDKGVSISLVGCRYVDLDIESLLEIHKAVEGGRGMNEHTPGPWEIKAHSDPCYRNISGPEHIALAQVVWCVEEEDQSPACEANARLIAAAPELLEALVDFIKLFGADDDPMLIDLLNKARAAITKAKGHTVRVNGQGIIGGPQERHRCELHSESGGHGEAVDVCLEDEDGKLWVENGEYASIVYFCPVCGYASRAKAKGENHE